MAINIRNLNHSGFSEYETYGSFVYTRYPNFYITRNWFSIRCGSTFFNNSNNLNENDIYEKSKLSYYSKNEILPEKIFSQ